MTSFFISDIMIASIIVITVTQLQIRKDKVNAVYAWISCIIDIGCIQVLAEMIFMHFNDSWYLDLVVCLCYVCVVCVFLLIIIIIILFFFLLYV